MANNSSRQNETERLPTMWEVFINDLPRVDDWIKETANTMVGWLFTTNASGGTRRRWVILLFFGYLWGRIAFNNTPVVLSGKLLADLVVYPWEALFAAATMRHVVLMATIFWLTLRQASTYLDDVFELKNVQIAERYLMQAIFASDYNTISIRDGDVAPEHMNSPIVKIGGPGKVQIHFDNVALFEKADGTPDVLGPENTGTIILDRYERIRAVIDLRDQVTDIDVRARTKDGIHISAQGAQMVYSISRGRKEPNLKGPHPYSKAAVKDIVYNQTNFKTFKTKQDKTTANFSINARNPSIEMRSFISDRFRKFINNHLLSEFLTQVQDPEFEAKEKEQEKIREESLKVTTGQHVVASNGQEEQTGTQISKGKFFTRDKISQLFYDEINKEALDHGMQLNWIDIGTWVLPEEAKKIQAEHLEAWNLSVENIQKSSAFTLGKVRKIATKEEMVRLLRETPLNTYFTYRQSRDEDPDQVIRKMVQAYWDRIRPVFRYYEERGEKAPEEIEYVTRYLGRVTPRKV
jgi:hypothetical protein